jgi:antagonist of KipI
MDPYAHRFANALVGNAEADATLEVTLVGPELECDDERLIAMTGAEFELTVDEQPVPMDTAVPLPARSRVRCGRRLRGARAYLAIAGGIDVPRVFGSRATHVATAMGGLGGRALRADDRLPVGPRRIDSDHGDHARAAAAACDSGRGDHIPASQLDDGHGRIQFSEELPDGYARVRILPGPNQDSFGADALDVLQSSPYRIDPRSDRMGFRLAGASLAPRRGTEMISEATSMGALQVPPSGQPILLMADRQTTGGYPTIATVITADLGLAGQLAPGDSIAFIVCSRAEAIAALIARERWILAATKGQSA